MTLALCKPRDPVADLYDRFFDELPGYEFVVKPFGHRWYIDVRSRATRYHDQQSAATELSVLQSAFDAAQAFERMRGCERCKGVGSFVGTDAQMHMCRHEIIGRNAE